jgi:hypothetical protein
VCVSAVRLSRGFPYVSAYSVLLHNCLEYNSPVFRYQNFVLPFQSIIKPYIPQDEHPTPPFGLLPSNMNSLRVEVAYLAILAVSAVTAQIPTSTSGAATPTKLSQIIPQLGDLERNDGYSRPPWIGGQNSTLCCLKAINASLAVNNGTLFATTDWILATPEELVNNSTLGQFPCNAQYNGDDRGAPVVQVPYQWYADNCPGWALSSQSNLNSWLQPLSGFLIPAVPLIFSIPRRRRLEVFREFFIADPSGIKSYVAAPLGAIGATIIVIMDTIIWLSTCFAFAAPMILSGLYEAFLDNRMLDFLKSKTHYNRLTLDMRARCLMVILIGNLDLALEKDENEEYQPLHQDDIAPPERGVIMRTITGIRPRAVSGTSTEFEIQNVEVANEDKSVEHKQTQMTPSIELEEPSQPDDDYGQLTERGNERPRRISTSRSLTPMGQGSPSLGSFQPRDTSQSLDAFGVSRHRRSQSSLQSRSVRSVLNRRPTVQQASSPWRHMENLLYEIRLYDDHDKVRDESPRQWGKHICNDNTCENPAHVEKPRQRNAEFVSFVAKTKTRLRTMLHCQYSFGTVVGTPVIFFLGGFVFALLSSLQNLGDEDIAEALAFGQWYMIIPHIAIISGLLLAGNNPNILEGVFATEREEEDNEITVLGLRFGLAYPSCYKTAWQWRRGHSKKKWINQIIETYGERRDYEFMGNVEADPDMEDLHDKTTLVTLDWVFILLMTCLLIYVPYVLAFLTSYYTPQIGLSCRSLTSTVYACCQGGQIFLWFWANCGPPLANNDPHRLKSLDFARNGGWLHRSGFFNPSSSSWFLKSSKGKSANKPWTRLRPNSVWQTRMVWCALYYFLAVLFGAGAIFAVLGGTLMQLMGVYSANMCAVTAAWWLVPFEQRPRAVISLNTAEMIASANRKTTSHPEILIINRTDMSQSTGNLVP